VAVLLSDDVVVLRRLVPEDAAEWAAGDDAERIDWPGLGADGPVRHWAICDQETGRLIGGVKLGAVDLSSVVFPAWRRRGMATRACRLALAYAASAMESHVAVVRVLQGDAASIALARRLGAVVTGMEVTAAGTITIVLRLDLA
jgi:RimJ/RimL family protein N-acetyltransferase